MPLFVGEAQGARVIQIGLGTLNVTASETQPVLFDLTTHDAYDGGPGASVEYRGIVVTLRHDAGFHVGVTPIVDGAALTEQFFQATTPALNWDGVVPVRAPFSQRGVRVAARVRQTQADGVIEVVDVARQFYVIRQAP